MSATSIADADSAELRELLGREAFLEARDGHDIRSRTGAALPWVYYGPAVTLTSRGASLMAAAVLRVLKGFASTQLATYGSSAIPVLSTCIAQGEGRYTGLVVRRERKRYAACRVIDGPIDRGRPVVVVDESIASGTSVYEAIKALEAEGLEVEGAICVVEFSGYGAREWLAGRGYRLETVFDVWRDLRDASEAPGRRAVARGERDPVDPLREPARDRAVSAFDGLSPASLAREAAGVFLRTGRAPAPPNRLDRDYDGRGGIFVSVRRRVDDVRVARAGQWHDGIEVRSPGAGVVQAAVAAVEQMGSQAPVLEELKFAVSFLGGPEPIEARQIDHERHALVVRGYGPLDRRGFALPNAPHYDDEIEQLRYARTVTAAFWGLEPFRLYRQSVERAVEPGERWPKSGAPVDRRRLGGGAAVRLALAARMAELLSGRPPDKPTRLPVLIDEPLSAVGVSLYRRGRGLIGCALSFAEDPDRGLSEATARALEDRRLAGADEGAATDTVAVIALLTEPRRLGRVARDRLALYFRLGRDTLRATAVGRTGLVLAHFAVQQSIGSDAYIDQVLAKAGIDAVAADWTVYDTTSWLVADGAAWTLDHGMPERSASPGAGRVQPRELAAELAAFVLRHCGDDSLPAYALRPWTAQVTFAGTATRVLLAVTGLLHVAPFAGAEVTDAATRMLQGFARADDVGPARPDLQWDSASDAQLLTALSLLGSREDHAAAGDRLVERLRPLIRSDGSVYSLSAPGRMAADLDLLSGSVLLALATAADWRAGALEGVDLAATLAFYRHRFAISHPWAMVWWHAQAWAALAARVPGARDFAFELVDWAQRHQSQRNGAYVIDGLEPNRVSFLTACVLEGVADAWLLARATGELSRAARYEQAWHSGIRHVERLVLHRRDAYFMANPESARGGVRATLVSTDVRVDYVGHALCALGKGMQASDPRSNPGHVP